MKKGYGKFVVAGCILLGALVFVLAPSARTKSDDENLNTNFSESVSQSAVSPCNQQTVAGPAKVTASLYLQGLTIGRPEIFVSVSYSGEENDTAGNAYSATGSGFAVFTTLSDHYVFPMKLAYNSHTNNSLSFSRQSDVTVLVDHNQTPTNVSEHTFPAACEQK